MGLDLLPDSDLLIDVPAGTGLITVERIGGDRSGRPLASRRRGQWCRTRPDGTHPRRRSRAVNDDRRRLDDIIAAAEDAALIVRRRRAAFDADPLVVRAAKNIVTEIGETTKALSSDTTVAIPDVPWRAIAGMRDRTIHRYPEVDLDVLWDTMEHDLPHLARAIRQHLDDTSS